MNDKNLLREIKLKLCTIPTKNYKEIEDINLSNKNLLGNTLNIDLKEISELDGLKTLSLKFFNITDDIIDSINSLKNLCNIKFYMCEFKTTKELNSNISSIRIYCCKNFQHTILNNTINVETLELTNSGLVDLTELQHLEKIKNLMIRDCSLISLPKISNFINIENLYLNNINLELDFEINKMQNLEFISFSGSKAPNKELYISKLEKQNSKVKIEWRENDLPIE